MVRGMLEVVSYVILIGIFLYAASQVTVEIIFDEIFKLSPNCIN
jgi:hypothetical protein